MRYAGEKRFNGWTALTLVLLALFLLFVIYPIGMLLIKSLFTGGKIDLSYFVKFFTKKYYWGALVNSFKVTVVSTLVASLIGVPMAYLLRSVKIRGAGLINILIVISYLSPPFIGAYSWIQLLGRNGFITRIANALFGVKLPGIYGFAGMQRLPACDEDHLPTGDAVAARGRAARIHARVCRLRHAHDHRRGV